MIRRRAQDGSGGGSLGRHQSARSGRLSWITATQPGLPPECGRHALADSAISLALHHRVQETTAAFDAIEPVLREVARHQFEDGSARRGAAYVLSQLHLDLSTDLFAANWTAPLDTATLHARCILGTFGRLIEQTFDRRLADLSAAGGLDDFLHRWRFHAIDVTPCADSRLVDAINYTLRMPQSLVVYRKPVPEALFNVEEAVRQWERSELRRWREAFPNDASSPTRYLKMCVYPFSSGESPDRSCVAQRGSENQAIPALLARLRQFSQAVRLRHGENALVATLLVGINASTDAIRVHVPDAHGIMHAGRNLNGHIIYNSTSALSREAAEEAIHTAVATCAGVSPNDAASSGMRWFCADLLKTNIAQIDFRREWRWLHSNSDERLIVVGDVVDGEPLRHIAYQVQMNGLGEGVAELDYGINVLRGYHDKRRLAIPLLVHVRTDPLLPAAEQHARERALHLVNEVRRRYDELVARRHLHIQAIIQDGNGGIQQLPSLC